MNEDKAMTDDQLRGLFQEMRDEPVPADSLARVRAGVSQRIEVRRAAPWRIGALAALITVGVFIAVLVWPRADAPIAAPEPIVPNEVRHEVAPPPPPPAPAPAQAKPKPRVISQARPKPRAVHETRPKAKRAAEEVVFRIQTEDPEVVILLVN